MIVAKCSRLRDDGEIEVYATLEFTEEEYIYWLYLRGMLTEEEFLFGAGLTLWEDRDEEVWQRVREKWDSVSGEKRMVHYAG